MKRTVFDTPLGEMLAIADERALLLLEFTDRRNLERQVERICCIEKEEFQVGETEPIRSVRRELERYFAGQKLSFSTPIRLVGTPFQKRVWNELQRIPYGETRSYAEIAEALEKPTAYRAVARANATNGIAIVVPCHRVISKGGDLSGYAGGVSRKEALLRMEAGSSAWIPVAAPRRSAV